jgi:hypothetical protein
MKDTIKYIALTKAVTSFTSRHHVDRGHFADTLDEGELKAMMKEHDEASKKHREAYEMAEARLILLREA